MRDGAAELRTWHIITCEYPPDIGGVADYSLTMATALSADGPVHVWSPFVAGSRTGTAGVIVRTELQGFRPHHLARLGSALNREATPRRLFVQWVPQGFGYRSVNVVFAAWLSWRAIVRGDELHLMVHEPFLPFLPHPFKFGVAVVQRLMLALAAFGATRIWLSTDAWRRRIAPFIPGRTPVSWLPVPANSPPGTLTARPAHQSQKPAVVGHFGTHSPLVTPLLASALDALLRDTSASVMLIGKNGVSFREQYVGVRPQWADRIDATGVLTPEGITSHLRRCDVMIQPYPDGVTTRRTSIVTLLQAGVPVVTNAGDLTEPLWAKWSGVEMIDAPDGERLGRQTAMLLNDSERRRALTVRAVEMYERCFAVRHAVEKLRGPGEQSPTLLDHRSAIVHHEAGS